MHQNEDRSNDGIGKDLDMGPCSFAARSTRCIQREASLDIMLDLCRSALDGFDISRASLQIASYLRDKGPREEEHG